MNFKYKLFGYNVESQLKLDAYEEEFEKGDIMILLDEIDLALVENQYPEGFLYTSKTGNRMVMGIPTVANYEILDGEKIVVEVKQGSKLEEVRLFLLGSSFCFLMHQRKEFPLHGSAVNIGTFCLTLVGHSGAGKSSLASGFVERGYKLITDDVSRVEEMEGGYVVHPSYPSQKLWQDTTHEMVIDFDPENRVMTGYDKYFINSRDRFCSEETKLVAIIEIEPSRGVSEPKLVKMDLKDSLNAVLTHSYRQEMMGQHTDLGAHLRFCSEFVKKIPVYKLYRPFDGFTVREQVQVLVEYFDKQD